MAAHTKQQEESGRPRRILVYAYGCLQPVENLEHVEQQLHLAHKYRNKLVEIENARRLRYRELVRGHGDVGRLSDAVQEHELRLADFQDAASAPTTLLRDLKRLRTEAHAVTQLARRDPHVRAALEESDQAASQQQKQARAASGLYWGTYRLVERAFTAAAKAQPAGTLKFAAWKGTGQIGVQLQSSTTAEDITSGRSTWLRIDALPADQWNTRSGRRAAKTTLHMRVGSERSRQPIWTTVPILLHRPLPTGAIIKEAFLLRRRIAQENVYEARLVLEAPPKNASVERTNAFAAINFGWRARPEGLRVGMLVDSHGQSQELILPQAILDRLDHADALQSERDRTLASFLVAVTASLSTLDCEQAAALRTNLVSSPTATACQRLIRRWHNERFTGDDHAFGVAESWRRKDDRLLRWSSFERQRALRHRRELYRTFSADIAKRYDFVIADGSRLTNLARSDRGKTLPSASHNRHRACLSSLRTELAARTAVVKFDTENITHVCNECGSSETFNAATQLVHTCSTCSATWDQDVNAARNLIRNFRERGISVRARQTVPIEGASGQGSSAPD